MKTDGPKPLIRAAITIKQLNDSDEARACAAMMANSEPWLTLRRDVETAFGMISGGDKEVYVARIGEELAGHIVVNMQGAFPGYIQALVVAPNRRSQQIGTRLLQFAEERIFRETPNVFLCVSSFNTRAQKFYARLGYERIGELKDYVIAGASEFFMRKTIRPKTDFQPAK